MNGRWAADTRSRLRWRGAWLVGMLVLMPPGPAASFQLQDYEPAERKAAARLPFGVGENLRYQLHAKWFLITGRGTASLSVEAVDTVHTFPVYRLVSRMKGGIAVFKIDDLQRSWLDVDKLFSRRFEQKLNQTTYNRDRTFDFLPDQMRYVQLGKPEVNGPLASAQPLDEVSFLYHLRTLALTVGREYREARYYKSDGNPVIARVLRIERIKVPAGEFEAIVVQPRIKSDGLFGEGGESLVWLSNDERRLPLRVRAKVKIATLTMDLESYTPGPATDSRNHATSLRALRRPRGGTYPDSGVNRPWRCL